MLKYGVVNKERIRQVENENRLLKKQIQEASQLIQNIQDGNFDSLATEDICQNELGNALKEMQYQFASIEEQKKQRNWITEGVAELSELLRKDYASITEVADRLLAFLVKYLNANQGCIFIAQADAYQQDQTYLEMLACYAYQRKKHFEQKIYAGEGLVGQVYLEGITTHLTDIPSDYINITSGLGEATPGSLLFVPIKIDEKIFGVLELASFYEFNNFHIEFLEKVCENIAATFNSVQSKERTETLLKESQMQTEQLRAQEEEMRQNAEELEATQEEMMRNQNELLQLKEELEKKVEKQKEQELELRAQQEVLKESMLEMKEAQVELTQKERELKGILEAINHASYKAEFAPDGEILFINKNFEKLFRISLDEIRGENSRRFNALAKSDPQAYTRLWENLNQGQHVEIESEVVLPHQTFWLKEHYTPVLDTNGEVKKIILISSDITSIQKSKAELIARTQAFEMSTILSESDIYGTITFVNDKLCEVSKYSRDELIGKPHKIFRHPDMPKEVFAKMWETIKNGKSFRTVLKNRAKDNSIYWVDAVITPVLDSNQKPVKYIGARYVIEDEKYAELLYKRALQNLGIQES
ncbi:PAS domain-containing protein [Rapidithrix thailandica]|uniref:PAS domain-containing protein n=1 Tax=Rapidithrix thailandica TaxID=413964 RepID=A0AAW9S5J5_9BACT